MFEYTQISKLWFPLYINQPDVATVTLWDVRKKVYTPFSHTHNALCEWQLLAI
jgi:hypothetical protein